MMNEGKYYSPFPLRVHEDYINKLRVIAAYNKKSINKLLETVIIRYIDEWESEHGEIELLEE